MGHQENVGSPIQHLPYQFLPAQQPLKMVATSAIGLSKTTLHA